MRGGGEWVKERYTEEIDAVIAYIHQHLDEPLPLVRLAKYVNYSPFHFSRIFKERTGLSPLYYVSSVRLHKAKALLLNTNLSVRDVAMEVGQQSLGTFTTRFSEKVGVTPANFRQSAQKAEELVHALKNLEEWPLSPTSIGWNVRVEGTVTTEVSTEGVILIGLFTKPIPEGLPAYGTLLASPGPFRFENVKPGVYYLMATSISWGMQSKEILLPQTTLRGRLMDPVIVRPWTETPPLKLTLHGPRLDDPPILISLPLLMNNFLNRIGRTGKGSFTGASLRT